MLRIFILSPARTSGKRASLLLSEKAEFQLAKRLRSRAGVPIGEVFSFLSGLYFRGKYTYSKHFGQPPAGLAAQYVITSDAGLMDAEESVSLERLKAFADVPIDPLEPRYTKPLQRSIGVLARSIPPSCEVVLLGSIATNKYTDILLEGFGSRLIFPQEFVGRGDMSRGGVLLRAVGADKELEYVSLTAVASRRGERPPKLPALKRNQGKNLQPNSTESTRRRSSIK
jgi:hypothetical protein